MTRPSFRAALALIAGIGLAARLVYVLAVMHDVPVGGDGLEFHILANQLASGDGYIQPLVVSPSHVPTADKPPLYPLLLALPSLLGWKSLVAHRVVSCLMGAALVWLVGLLGRRVGGERVGLLAAGIAALYPLLVVLDGSIRSESLYAPLIALALLLAYERRFVLLGVTLGLATLTRSEAVLLLPLLLIAMPRPRLRPAVVVVACCLVVVAPWLVRNWSEFGHPLLSTNEGSLVYGANCDAAYYSRQIGTWPCYPRLTVTPGRDEADVSSELRSTGLDYAHDHSGRVPAVMGVRLLRTFDMWSPNRATRLEAAIGNRDVTAYRAGVALYFLLAPLAVAGALILRRRGEALAVLLAPLALVVIVALLGYGTPRFRVPAEIPIVVLAAVAIDAVVRARRGEPAREVAA